ncbi:myoD family inhibitor [Arapaima gigas]
MLGHAELLVGVGGGTCPDSLGTSKVLWRAASPDFACCPPSACEQMSDKDCHTVSLPEHASEAQRESDSPSRSPGPGTDQANGAQGRVEDAGTREERSSTENRNNRSCLSTPYSLSSDSSITCQPEPSTSALHTLLDPSPIADGGKKNSASAPHPQKNGSARNRPAPGSLPQSPGKRATVQKLHSNPSLTSQGSKRSKSSSKSASSQIPSKAQDDCCVHCILACLFCEFLTLCNIVLDCATCGSCTSDESCFCCCCGSEECGDCDLPCDMDCGIIDACCESADCLEICMECCGLCFSS